MLAVLEPIIQRPILFGDQYQSSPQVACYERERWRNFGVSIPYLRSNTKLKGRRHLHVRCLLCILGLIHIQKLDKVAIGAPKILNLSSDEHFSGPYGEDVVFIANDWRTTLLACYFKSVYKSTGSFTNAKPIKEEFHSQTSRFLISLMSSRAHLIS